MGPNQTPRRHSSLIRCPYFTHQIYNPEDDCISEMPIKSVVFFFHFCCHAFIQALISLHLTILPISVLPFPDLFSSL